MEFKRKSTREVDPNEDLMTRAEIVKRLDIPESSPQCTIVRPNCEGIGFRFTCYSHYLNNIVEKSRFDETVFRAHKICVETWNAKKKEEHSVYNKFLKHLIMTMFAVITVAFLLVIIEIYSTDSSELYYPILVLFLVAGGISIYVLIKTMIEKPSFIQFEEKTLEKLHIFLQRENESFYNAKGLHWDIQKRFFWLECNKI